MERPLQIYVSVLMFAPTSSAVKRLFSIELPDFISMPHNIDSSWGAELSGFVSIEHEVDNSQSGESDALEGSRNPACLAISPNGMFFAVGVHSWMVIFQKTTTGISQDVMWDKRLDGLQALAFSSDNKSVVSCSRGLGKIQFWETTTGTLQNTIDEDVSNVTSLVFTDGDQLLASPSESWDFITWSCATGIQRYTIGGRLEEHARVTLSSNGLLLASHSCGTYIDLWLFDVRYCHHKLLGHAYSVTCITFSPDCRLLASGDQMGIIILWDTVIGVRLQHFKWSGAVLSITLSTDGQLLASSHENFTEGTGIRNDDIAVWDLNQSSLIQILRENFEMAEVVRFSPDNKALASFGSVSETWITLWDITQISRNQQPHPSSVINIAFSLDGRLLASECIAGRILIWDVTSESIIENIEGGHMGLILAFSPNNTLLAFSSSPRVIELWDMKKRELSSISVPDENQAFYCAAFSPDGQLMACLIDRKDIKIWDIATNTLRQTITKSSFEQPMDSICFSPNGQYLASSALCAPHIQRWQLINIFRVPNRDERTRDFSFFISEEKTHFSRGGFFHPHDFPLFQLWTPQGDFDPSRVSKWNYGWTNDMQVQWAVHEPWVYYLGKKVVCLDDNHDASCWASNNNTIAIGHRSGGVTFIKLLPQSGRFDF